MTEISSLVDGLRSEEVALLQQRRATTDRTAQTVLRVIVVSDVLAVVFVVFASGAMQQTLTRRKAAERALLQAYAHMEPWEQGGPTALSQPNSEWRHESFERQLAEGPPHVQPNAHDNPKH